MNTIPFHWPTRGARTVPTDVVELPKGGVRSIRPVRPTRVVAVRGTCWITDSDQGGDQITRAGDELLLQPGAHVVIEALIDSEILLQAA
jgi:hypothetical protein